jgi:1-acyl-sn-glycerol-3-phosphate acyltransferase
MSVLGYIDTPERKNSIFPQRYRTGLLRMAKELNVPITPIIIDNIELRNGSFPKQNFNIYIGKTFFVNDIGEDIGKIKKLFTKKKKLFKTTKYIF